MEVTPTKEIVWQVSQRDLPGVVLAWVISVPLVGAIAGEAPLGWLSDVGVGLRIGNARSGLGNVLHIDLAVPLVRQDGIDSVQLLVETRHSF